MNWCFVYQNYVTGGLETYVLRMCKYLNNKNPYILIIIFHDKLKRTLYYG